MILLKAGFQRNKILLPSQKKLYFIQEMEDK